MSKLDGKRLDPADKMEIYNALLATRDALRKGEAPPAIGDGLRKLLAVPSLESTRSLFSRLATAPRAAADLRELSSMLDEVAAEIALGQCLRGGGGEIALNRGPSSAGMERPRK